MLSKSAPTLSERQKAGKGTAEGKNGISLDGRYRNQETGAAPGGQGGAGCGHRGRVGGNPDGILPAKRGYPNGCSGSGQNRQRADEEYHSEDHVPAQPDLQPPHPDIWPPDGRALRQCQRNSHRGIRKADPGKRNPLRFRQMPGIPLYPDQAGAPETGDRSGCIPGHTGNLWDRL